MLSIAEWTDRALALSSLMKLTSSASFSPSIRISLRLKIHQAQAKNFCRVLDIRVAQIVKTDVLRADGFQNFVMGSPEGVWVIHSPGLGRWKQIRIARVLFVFGNQQVDCLLRKGQRSYGVACFRRTDHQFPIDAIYLFRDGKRFALYI